MSEQTLKRVVFSHTATPKELREPKHRQRLALLWLARRRRQGKDPRNSTLLCVRAKYKKL